MTSRPTDGNHLPIYEGLVRELGDVVMEARTAAEHTQHQAAALLMPHHAPHHPYPQASHDARPAAGTQAEPRENTP
ncbi:hypothetical protein GCM10010121_086190 [Streptomyces brasiliensis]|uniref:Uncharacterized protein n=1 Tax=Streptomyces brasiliensis TaxID=1954 RepID=A0A917UJP5_9ACTN|nr:hypothetical protein GCM10010121_086190 [Streptomyces brasiliensis]